MNPVYHDGKLAHMAREVAMSRRTTFNYCARCVGWFEPPQYTGSTISDLTQTAEDVAKRHEGESDMERDRRNP